MMADAAAVEPNIQQAVPFFWVRDIDASVTFYVDGLGFRLTNKWVDHGTLRWCRLKLGGAAIMLQGFWLDGPHRNVPATPTGVGVSIAFICKDTIALYRELVSRGVAATRPSVGNSMWTTHVVDPDGYNLYFESPTDATEETLYSDSL
jgi:lactoylglutathione lyase